MVSSDLVIIRPSMEQSTIDSCTTLVHSCCVLHRNGAEQNLEIAKIERMDSVERAHFALLRIQGEFAVSIKTKTPVMERFALYED